MKITAIVLAAGKGTRFKSANINKVALPLAGKPIILYGIELLEKLGIRDIFVVVGFASESVKKELVSHRVRFVEQKEQLGTANAVATILSQLLPETESVLVINGDDPFHKEENVRRLIEVHESKGVAVTFTTSKLDDPTGMGRIVRNSRGNIVAIVEEKDATEEQKKIHEVNGACYIFSLDFLQKYLPKLNASGVSGEYYLTGLIALAAQNGEKIETLFVKGKWKGINTPEDLREAEKLLNSLA